MKNDDEMKATEQAQFLVSLPTEADAEPKRKPIADIDFNYRDLSDEERISRAVKDMEVIYASYEPPKMPKQIPRFVKAYLWNTPSHYLSGFSQAGFPAAATLMDDVTFKHPNNLYYPAKLNADVVGDSGVGKNGLPFIFNALLADLMVESHDNMEREVEIKEQNSLLGINEKKKAQPEP